VSLACSTLTWTTDVVNERELRVRVNGKRSYEGSIKF
jgi:hypothetical protein